MEQHPSTTAEYLDVPLILQRETGEYLLPERFFTTDPGHEAVDDITSFCFLRTSKSLGGLGLDLRSHFPDHLFTGRNPLELITAQTDCRKANAEQKSDHQPQCFHYPITIPSSKSSS